MNGDTKRIDKVLPKINLETFGNHEYKVAYCGHGNTECDCSKE